MCSLILSICDDSLLLLRTKNKNDTYNTIFLDFFSNKSKITFSDDKLLFSLNHIMFLNIHICEYLTIK